MPLLQLSVQQHLRDPVDVLHSDDVSCPSQLALDDQSLDAGEAKLLQDLEVGYSVLPLDVADLPQTLLVKLLQLLDVPAVGFRGSTSRSNTEACTGPQLCIRQSCWRGGYRGLAKVSLSVLKQLDFGDFSSPERERGMQHRGGYNLI